MTRSYLYRNRLVDSVYCRLYASLLSRITFGISVRSANRLANKLEPFHFLFVGYLHLVPLFRSGALSRRCSDTAISTSNVQHVSDHLSFEWMSPTQYYIMPYQTHSFYLCYNHIVYECTIAWPLMPVNILTSPFRDALD